MRMHMYMAMDKGINMCSHIHVNTHTYAHTTHISENGFGLGHHVLCIHPQSHFQRCASYVRRYVCLHECVNTSRCPFVYCHAHMCAFLCTCLYTCLRTCPCTCQRMSIHTNMHISIRTYAHMSKVMSTHVYTCLNTCLNTCLYTCGRRRCLYILASACVYICMHMWMQMPIHYLYTCLCAWLHTC